MERGAGGLTWSWGPSGRPAGSEQGSSSGRGAAGTCRLCRKHRRRRRSRGTGGRSPWRHTSSPHSPARDTKAGVSHVVLDKGGMGTSRFHNTHVRAQAHVCTHAPHSSPSMTPQLFQSMAPNLPAKKPLVAPRPSGPLQSPSWDPRPACDKHALSHSPSCPPSNPHFSAFKSLRL